MELRLEQVVEHFRNIRSTHGEGDYQAALRTFAKDLLLKDKGTEYILNLLKELEATLDLDALKAEAAAKKAEEKPAASPDPSEVVINAVKETMPNLKTQAQFDLFMRAFEALRIYLNATYGQDLSGAAQARRGLEQTLDLAPKLSELADKLKETPEATTNSDFTEAPKEFTETSKADKLLAELEELESLESLSSWYQETAPLRNELVTQSVRDRVFDAIRRHKHNLELERY